jgi:hypothetical protein
MSKCERTLEFSDQAGGSPAASFIPQMSPAKHIKLNYFEKSGQKKEPASTEPIIHEHNSLCTILFIFSN